MAQGRAAIADFPICKMGETEATIKGRDHVKEGRKVLPKFVITSSFNKGMIRTMRIHPRE